MTVESQLFGGVYADRKVLLTGHTGFKGSWLATWLQRLGADVTGYSLQPATEPAHYDLLDLPMTSVIGDVRNQDDLFTTVQKSQPEIVFHLAAQPLVLESYQEPVATYQTNVLGTLHLLEACRNVPSVRAIVIVTTDKVYENKEWERAYHEIDRLGGRDPYSASKACVEILVNSYRASYLNHTNYRQTHTVLMATARAGNVIGGGDWAPHRLVPDIVRAVHAGEKVVIRYPYAVRPWQHVLDPLAGYLLLGKRLLEGEVDCAVAWNFGPLGDAGIRVCDVVETFKDYWGSVDSVHTSADSDKLHEASLLKLDCSKAVKFLQWKPLWDTQAALRKTVEWYQRFYEDGNVRTHQDLDDYIESARADSAVWCS